MAEEAPAPTPAAPCWSNIVKQKPSTNQHHPGGGLTAEADRVFVDGCKSTKGIAVAVIDATAIIQGGEKLVNCADKFVSVSEVMEEVKDPMSRHRLNFVPFTVETREPSPESFKKVIKFARATGDLQTLSDVDLKLIALTYTLEAQIHGTTHLRDIPPPIHTVNVKRLPEKDMPGWGSNVPNLEEWEALEPEREDRSNHNSRILPLKDLDMNAIPNDQHDSAEDGSMGNEGDFQVGNEEDADGNFRKPRKYVPQKKEVNIEGKKMVSDGIDESQGQLEDNAGDWLPAVSRSTHRKYLRRKAKREMYEVQPQKDSQQDAVETIESNNIENEIDQLTVKNLEETHVDGISEERKVSEEENIEGNLSRILNQMRLGEDSSKVLEEGNKQCNSCAGLESNTSTRDEATFGENEHVGVEEGELENVDEAERMEMPSQTNENLNAYVDDSCSEQSWMVRSLSESSVACVTSDFAMQNVLLQMGLRLLAPGGMQIRQLHRWILKCHACFKVTTEIGRIFCPSCGNGGTLRKVAVTVGENGIVLASRRPYISLRGTQFSLPLPKGGRDGITKNPILREDQLPQKFLYPKTKKKNKQGDDIFASDGIFSHHTDKRAPLQPPIRKAMAVFSGRRNPNDNHFSRSKC